MILVAGGTGLLGTEILRELRTAGLPTRVLTREPARAEDAAAAGSQVVRGDVRDPASLQRALQGVDTVVSAMHGLLGPRGVSPTSVDRDGNIALVEAARSVGADLVMVSMVGVAPDSPYELFRAAYAGEEHLRRSGLSWTVVRAPAFLETWLGILRGTAARSGRPTVLGRGDNPVGFASVADVANRVAGALTDPGSRGTVIEIEATRTCTMNHLATQVAAEAGAGKAPRHVPRPALRALGAVGGLVSPQVGRLDRTALVMDTTTDAAARA